MQLLHVIPEYEPAIHLGAGVVRSTSQLCRGLANLGIQVTVYTTDRGLDSCPWIPRNQPVDVGGVRVHYFKTDQLKTFHYSRALKSAVFKNTSKFDIIHLTSFWNYPGIPAGCASRRYKVPYIMSPRGTLIPYDLRKSRLKKLIYLKLFEMKNLRGAAAIHYTTEMERRQTAHLGLTNPTFLVSNGFDLSEFDDLPAKSDARRSLGLDEYSKVITYLGRLHPRKALDVFIKAFASISGSLPESLLVLAGPDNGSRNELLQLARDLRIADKVRFLGFVGANDRKSLLAATDLLELVTWPGENFGNVVVEAMACGIPVLVSEHVGLAQQVRAYGAGSVVPVEAVAISEEVAKMLSDQHKLHMMGQAGHKSARKHYQIQGVAQQMVTAYNDILNGQNCVSMH